MKKILLAALAMAVSGQVCFGQTNAPAAATPLQPGPALKLTAKPQESAPANSPPAGANSLTGQMIASSASSNTAAMSRIELEGRLQSQGPANGSDFERKAAAAFRPEITQIGRAQFYSPVGTAIARKNPLCLLDPKLFEISW